MSNKIRQIAQKVNTFLSKYVIIDKRGDFLNWITSTEQAIEYIESNITEKLDYDDIAAAAFCSSYHFQRMFSVFAGCTLGEYIRARKMTLAAAELKNPKARIIDVAIKYGYESQEGFARAFTKFHGITPSLARKRGARLKSYSRLTVYELAEGGNILDYSIEELSETCYMGYKKRFEGAPYGDLRHSQENDLFANTCNEQWILKGISSVCSNDYNEHTDYCIIDNITDDGYDFYYAQPTDIKGDVNNFNLKKIILPKATYAIFKTPCENNSSKAYRSICKQIYCEWLPSTNYCLTSAPELVVYHSFHDDKDTRFIEIYIPVSLIK